MPSKWAQERARDIMDAACLSERYVVQGVDAALRRDIAAALDEAESRGIAIGKMEAETTANLDSPTRPFSEFKADVSRYRQGRDSILARLRNPDEAMVEALIKAPVAGDFQAACRALADVLATPPEATEEK